MLLDAPCSSTGTVRRHPDVPWTKSPDDIDKLADAAVRACSPAAARLVKPGGRIVFSNCSLDPARGRGRWSRHFSPSIPMSRSIRFGPAKITGVDPFLTAQGTLRTTPADLALGRPEISGLDGFFAARFLRSV